MDTDCVERPSSSSFSFSELRNFLPGKPSPLSFYDASLTHELKNAADMFYPQSESASGTSDSMIFPSYAAAASWGASINGHHRRSCSVTDVLVSDAGAGFGWKPCLYFARGYCKNGTSCRFLHGLPDSPTGLFGGLFWKVRHRGAMPRAAQIPLRASLVGSSEKYIFEKQIDQDVSDGTATPVVAIDRSTPAGGGGIRGEDHRITGSAG
ncbi:TPA_asm: hypothetical protein HUJ06_000189 [Nelumbo nucifera]|uniref:C3H1-type domain-containing protein n=1 Tax=Nelumbo nucifera TaxID=4432 RepID=A0A823A324_NELNU|nr:TPA_asm: hypothetical protein HUJ06_022594 [Nelumbo nucifera]DAD49805.1 TPA_asm: hypothetical protein HUJ06_000189 [Nelumbo nucifera]